MRKLRLQSATEYLTTYAWAIVIIVAVSGALFYLGVLNGSAVGSRSSGGECQVQRSVVQVSFQKSAVQEALVGVCSGLYPNFVAEPASSTSNVLVDASNSLYIIPQTTGFTASIWFEMPAVPTSTVLFTTVGGSGNGCGYKVALSSSAIKLSDACTNQNDYASYPYSFKAYTWYNVQVSVGPGSAVTPANIMVNGMNYFSGDITGTWSSGAQWTQLLIGGGIGSGGYISNFQLYNASLSQAEMKSLYYEGIGGVPQELQDLVGWWQLNGNTKDYSGEGNNGAANGGGIEYTSSWTGGYTPP